MRVLVFSSFPPGIGGGELQTSLQLREMVRKGHGVTVVDCRPRDGGPSEEHQDGMTVHRISPPRASLFRTVSFHIALAERARFLAPRAQIAQLNHIGPALIAPALVLEAHGVPRVLVVWGSAADGVGPFAGGLRNALARWAARRCEVVVALSSVTRRNLERRRFRAERIVYIPNGVETDVFRPGDPADRDPPPRGWPEGTPVALAVGRLVPAKGLDVLLAAWSKVVPTHRKAVLALAGDGPLRAELESQATRLGIATRVAFLGERTDVPALLRRAQVYVSSSRSEGMSNALLEALSSGLPIVATTVGGAEDIVQPHRNGLLVPPGESDALADALARVLSDTPMREQFARAARRRALESFSISTVVEKYLELYVRFARA